MSWGAGGEGWKSQQQQQPAFSLLCLPITHRSHAHAVLSFPWKESQLIIDDNVAVLMYREDTARETSGRALLR